MKAQVQHAAGDLHNLKDVLQAAENDLRKVEEHRADLRDKLSDIAEDAKISTCM